MSCRALIAGLLLAGAFATLSAQSSSIQGNVLGTDGRPLKEAEVRFDQKDRRIPPIIARTDVTGHYNAVLPVGFYKMSIMAGGAVKSAVSVKATGANSRIDFDLRPSAEKQIRHYVWVSGSTGSHLPGRWIEAGVRAARSRTP